MKIAVNIWTMTMAALSLSFSCSSGKDNVLGCPANMMGAMESIHIEGHLISFTEQPDLHIYNIHVIDSFLVAKAGIKESSDQMFVFNLLRKKYTGNSFITKGRGPDELLNPFCYGSYNACSENGLLYVFDLSLCESYAFNVETSMKTGKTELSKICGLPPGTLYAYPFKDSMHFVKVLEPDCISGMILNPNGSIVEKTSLYGDVSGHLYFDKLSSADAFFWNTSKMAMAMTMLPQVNFIDITSGEKHTVAINKRYREWEQLLYDDTYTPSIYYTAAIRANKTIIALYYGASLVDWAADKVQPHLHIFNAEGIFLYDISLAETLKAIAYDQNTGILYGADTESRIYQYDMSGIL